MDLHILDQPLDYIRKHPDRFLRLAPVQAEELAQYMVKDAAILGVVPVTLDQINGWWIVTAGEDWITKENCYAVQDTFHRIVPFPQQGANCHRAEVLLTAFADDLVTWQSGKRLVINGCDDPLDALEIALIERYGDQRIVAFRLGNEMIQRQ